MTQATFLQDHRRLSQAERAMSRDRLIARLIKGQQWLIDTHERLFSLPDIGLGSRLERQFLSGLDQWDYQDSLLRQLYDYQHCIHGPSARCPDAAILNCRGCSK